MTAVTKTLNHASKWFYVGMHGLKPGVFSKNSKLVTIKHLIRKQANICQAIERRHKSTANICLWQVSINVWKEIGSLFSEQQTKHRSRYLYVDIKAIFDPLGTRSRNLMNFNEAHDNDSVQFVTAHIDSVK